MKATLVYFCSQGRCIVKKVVAAGEIFEKTLSKSAPQAKYLKTKKHFFMNQQKSSPTEGGQKIAPPPGGIPKLNKKIVPLRNPPEKNPPPSLGFTPSSRSQPPYMYMIMMYLAILILTS